MVVLGMPCPYRVSRVLCCVWVKGVLCLSQAFFLCVVSLSYDETDESHFQREQWGPEPQRKRKEKKMRNKREHR